MVQRCTNPKAKDWANYGGRGIIIDPDWMKFDSFYRDMGDPPRGLTLDRQDNDAGYCKANCRWATRSEQARNQRRPSKAAVIL